MRSIEEDLPGLRSRTEFLTFLIRAVNSMPDLDSLLKLLMDGAITLVGAERGFILVKGRRGELEFRVARKVKREDLEQQQFEVSRTVIQQVLDKMRPLLVGSASDDPHLSRLPSVRMFGLRSILGVPMVVDSEPIGVIYLDNRLKRGAFVDADLELIRALADQATLAVMHARLREERNRARQFLERYVSPQVASALLESEEGPFLSAQAVDATILFADVVGFTSLAQKRPPEQVLGLLNDHFTRLVEIVFAEGGTVKQFAGDELMAIFGAPVAYPDHVARACRAAVAMCDAVSRWQKERETRGLAAFGVKVGLHTGKVVVGSLGSPQRMEYAAVGDVVNTSSRIMQLCSAHGLVNAVLVSQDVVERCEWMKAWFRPLGLEALKGRDSPVSVFQLLTHDD
ncbi:MAG: GAF domain-containing protein [Armatimonadetes bacterium]|nr:GAF domain-containing protein [Armatimonadota bacterium]